MIKIAIDGPSGAGKSSLAKAVAAHYKIIHVDTGAIYRAVALYIVRKKINPYDTAKVIDVLSEITLEIKFEDGEQQIYLCGEKVGDKIRTPQISSYSSTISAIPKVRAFLLDIQREIAKNNDVVMDGRDIGTVIIPEADAKIFLVASNEARAARRYAELWEKGMNITYSEVLALMTERDKNDRNRKTAPAVAASDAVILDNSKMTRDETIARAIQIIDTKLKAKEVR